MPPHSLERSLPCALTRSCARRWTQWIFLQLLERGLAYQAEVPVNWCPALGTVLANEEVQDGARVASFWRAGGPEDWGLGDEL